MKNMKRILILVTLLALLTPLARTGAADATNAVQKLDFQYFQLISQNNIFDPYRRPRRTNTVQHTYDYFTLNGTMSYENKSYAFFSGSTSQYSKTVQPSDVIAGYRIAEITNNAVKLAASSNKVINLMVGMQMRREDRGPWALVSNGAPPSDSESSDASGLQSTESTSPTPMTPGASADVMQRLMARRAQEMQGTTNTTTNENR